MQQHELHTAVVSFYGGIRGSGSCCCRCYNLLRVVEVLFAVATVHSIAFSVTSPWKLRVKTRWGPFIVVQSAVYDDAIGRIFRNVTYICAIYGTLHGGILRVYGIHTRRSKRKIR